MKNLLLIIIVFVTSLSYCQTAEEYFKRGVSKFNLKDYQGAIEDITKAIEINPKDSDAFNYRGLAFNYIGFETGEIKNFDNAFEDYSKAIELDSKNASAYHNRGLFKYYSEDAKGAIDDLTEASKLDPKDNTNYFTLGLAKLKLNQKESACLDFNKAKELGNEEAIEMIKKNCNKK